MTAEIRLVLQDHECAVWIQCSVQDAIYLAVWMDRHEAYFMDDHLLVFPQQQRAFVTYDYTPLTPEQLQGTVSV